MSLDPPQVALVKGGGQPLPVWDGDLPSREILDGFAGLAAGFCEMPMAVVGLFENDQIRFAGRVGLEITESPREDPMLASVLSTVGLHVVTDVDTSRFAEALGIRFCAGVPLVGGSGKVAGALCVMDRVPRSLSPSQSEALRQSGRLLMAQLETQRRTRGLIKSEKRLRAIIENEPECVKLLGANCELLDMNPAGLKMIDAGSLDEVIGNSVLDLVRPEHRSAFADLTKRVMRGATDTLEFEIQGIKGTRRWLETHATPMRNEMGEIISLLGITRDVSERKRNRSLLRGQRKMLELIASSSDVDQSLTMLAKFVESQAPGLLCSILVLDPDGIHLQHGAAPSLPESFYKAFNGESIGEGKGSCGTAASRGEAVFVTDISTDPLWSDYREQALKHGLRACWSTPVFDGAKQVIGTFAIYYREPGQPTEAHQRIIRMATNIAAIAIGRHRQAEALRRNHTLLEAVIEGSSDVIYIKDLEGRYQFINTAGIVLAGLTREEVIGHTDSELLPAETAAQFRELDREVLAANAAIIREEIGTLNGEERVLSSNKAPWKDHEGRTLGIIGVTRDISGRRKAEADLRASEERFRLFMDNSPTTSWVKDEAGRYVFVNKPFEHSYGKTRDDWDGRVDAELWPEFGEEFRRNDLAVLAAGHAIQKVEIARDANGELIHVLVSKFSFTDEEGRRFVAGIGLDISERILADEELHRSELNYRTLVESASDGILVTDMAGKLLDVNAAGCAMFGHTREEMLGTNIANFISPDERDRVAPEMARLEPGHVIQSEWKTLKKDGSTFPSELGVTVLPDGRALAIVRDVSERKKLEQQFFRAQRMESIGTLAGGIAHDLNNALGPILMSLDLLKMKFPELENHKLIDIIETSALRGAEMVKQVLSFARGVEGRKLDVHAGQLLREVEKIANDTFLKNIAVTVSAPPGLWVVTGDPTQLHQVLMNLCVNARDAMPHGGTLRLSAENQFLDARRAESEFVCEPGPYLIIRVADNGSGMSAAVLDHIFDPFFTTKGIGAGTGLGLSTSQAIIKSHHGFIQVDSELGKGTSFHIYLPARATHSAPEADPDSTLPHGKGELVLMLEDETLVRQVTCQTLETFGYRVHAAAKGADAVAYYLNHRDDIAVVITDMMMPGMDGTATIQALQQINPDIRIIATSGLTTTQHVEKITGLGVKRFLAKPYTAQALLCILREEMDNR